MSRFARNSLALSAVGTLSPPGDNAQNWFGVANWNGASTGLFTNVGTNGGPSAYGTYDQSAMVEEVLENYSSTTTTVNMLRHGGSYDDTLDSFLRGTNFYEIAINARSVIRGFRVATIENFYNLPNFVRVGDPGNSADGNGNGAVNYWFRMGRYLVTNSDYIQYLDAIAGTDITGSVSNVYATDMGSTNGGITRTQIGGSGATVSYAYALKPNFANKPITFLSWQMAARYCNWLHNNKPTGGQNASTTEDGAYDMALSVPVRKTGALYYLPNRNEWVKAGFYKGGSISAGYWIYSTQCNVVPMACAATSTGVGLTPQAVLSNLGVRNEITASSLNNSGSNTYAMGFATNNSEKLLLSSASFPNGTGTIAASIYSDNNGVPGTLLYQSFASRYIGNGADGNRQSRAYFKNAVLQPNTTYWIALTALNLSVTTWAQTTANPATPIAVNNSGYSFVGTAVLSNSVWAPVSSNDYLNVYKFGLVVEASRLS